MSGKVPAERVAVTTAGRLAVMAVTSPVNEGAALNPWVSFVYLPAGVTVIALLAFGYWAAAGVALSAFIWNLFHKDISFTMNGAVSLALGAACILSFALFKLVSERDPDLRRSPRTLLAVIALVLILGVVSPLLHQLAFWIVPEIAPLSTSILSWMIFGDVLGALIMFIALNAATSVWIRWRLSR